MVRTAQITLPGGRRLDYEIRFSAKSRHLRLKMTARTGLTVIAPKGLDSKRVTELVAEKSDWIVTRLVHFDEVRDLIGKKKSTPPQAFDLPALAESWRVEYRETRGKTVGARTDRSGRVLVYGAVADVERCNAALRRWLARRAKEVLGQSLRTLATEAKLRFTGLTIKSQRTRWGSCSKDRVISLNSKLLFIPRDLVRYVMHHELCHIVERNHTQRFWTIVRQYEPKTEVLHGCMRQAWKLIPAWAHPIHPAGEGF